MSLFGWSERHAARKALDRTYCVPYLAELSSREHHGMLLLERSGLVQRDEGFSGLHWHLTDAGRSWFFTDHDQVAA